MKVEIEDLKKQNRSIMAQHNKSTLQFVDNRPLNTNQRLLNKAIQLYSETLLDKESWTDKMMAIRRKERLGAKSYLGHNMAFQSDNEENYAVSQANGHAEGKVMNIFLASRGRKSKVDIITERQPCSNCESDLKHIESCSKPTLAINTFYFIDYTKGKGAEPLQTFYEKWKWTF